MTRTLHPGTTEDRPVEDLVDDLEPYEVERTGDDGPAGSLWGYIWRMSGKHQLAAGLVAILVSALNLIPVELQRRIVDDAITPKDLDLLWTLGLVYAGVIVLHQIVKFGLRLYQGRISESAILYTRRHLVRMRDDPDAPADSEDRGSSASIITTETDKLGGFVGEGIVQFATSTSLLLGAVAYMMVVEPSIAMLGLACVLPQVLLTPLMQKRLNQLVEDRVAYMRDMTRALTREENTQEECGEIDAIMQGTYANRMRFFFVKFLMKALLNLLNALTPIAVLLYGGYMVIEGDTTVGVVVAFLTAFERVAAPLRELIAFYRASEQAKVQHRMIASWMCGKPL